MARALQPARTARIEARIAPDALVLVKRAAEIQGRSISDFVLLAAQEAANRTIAKTQIIRLSVEDQRVFADAILNPPAPAPAMQRAAEAYRVLVKAPQTAEFRIEALNSSHDRKYGFFD